MNTKSIDRVMLLDAGKKYQGFWSGHEVTFKVEELSPKYQTPVWVEITQTNEAYITTIKHKLPPIY